MPIVPEPAPREHLVKSRLAAAIAFFSSHAAYSWQPAKETEEQGRHRCAECYALAEQWADEHGVTFEWSGGEEFGSWVVTAYDRDRQLLAVEDGIIAPDEGPTAEAARVVEARLAQEARDPR